MGHDSHFLSRLDRVTPEQCELALGLYRDHEVVKKVLDAARLPDGAERVAISMDDPHDGPFIIVARDGHFVTCLGKGMHVKATHPVVTRGQLDTIATSVHTLRDQLRRAREVAPTDGELARLFKRVGKAGHLMPYEDFSALALWAPMMWNKYLIGFLDAQQNAELKRSDLLVGDPRNASRDTLEDYWKSVYGMTHLGVLCTLGSAEPWKEIGAFLARAKGTFTRTLIEHQALPLSMRALWMAARIGEPLIDSYEAVLFSTQRANECIDSMLGLAGVAVAHEATRPRIEAIFDEGMRRWADVDEPSVRLRRELVAMVRRFSEMNPASAETLKLGAARILVASAQLRKDSEYRYADGDEVSPTLAIGAIANSVTDSDESTGPIFPFLMLPFVPLVGPELLYLPRGLARATSVEWSPALTLELLARPTRGYRPRQPVRAPPQPGRNDPCSCGSGKKFKKCHGA